jgi:hypothetical protein
MIGFQDVSSNSSERSQTGSVIGDVLSTLLVALEKWIPCVDGHPALSKAGNSGQSPSEPIEPQQKPPWENAYSENKKVPRTLSHCPFRREYRPRQSKEEHGTGIHWGQRKLLMCEIEFLCKHAKSGDTVVYAGAAPGRHILTLAELLFPELDFQLYDPAPFNIRPSRNVGIHQECFTRECAQKFHACALEKAVGQGMATVASCTPSPKTNVTTSKDEEVKKTTHCCLPKTSAIMLTQ